MSLHGKTLTELKAGLDGGEFTAREIVEALIGRIESLDGNLNAFVTVLGESAIEQADASDARRAAGEAGPLEGLPIVHKDIFCTRGVRTTCGSRMLENFVSPYNATVVERLAAAGAIMLG
ncbi:MAG: amidase family protein, partial [Pseudomonadota bacterium]